MSSPSLQPILALLGFPIEANPSQFITEKAFDEMDLDWRYLTLEVAPDDLDDAVRGIRALGFAGGNLAEPHKEAVIPLLERLSESARRIGSVNILLRDDEGLFGENTEGKAVVELIRERAETEGVEFDLASSKVVLLGAGPMARAISVELAAHGIGELVLVGQSESKTRALAEQLAEYAPMAVVVEPWNDDYRIPEGTQVVIHTTSMEEGEYNAAIPLDWERLADVPLVVDLTVDPPHTHLLREAETRGAATIDGVEVLCRQAVMNVKLWTGVEPEVSLLRDAVEEYLEL